MKTAKTTKFIAMLAGMLLLGSALIPLTSYAESATVTASVTIPSALSMYIDNDDGKGDVEVTEGGSNTWTN